MKLKPEEKKIICDFFELIFSKMEGIKQEEQPKVDVAAEKDSNRWIPVTEWNNYHSWPTTSGLRWLIFNEKHNGFHKCICRAGRRILIDERAFFEWLQNNKAR
jgi:hypothetical protein